MSRTCRPDASQVSSSSWAIGEERDRGEGKEGRGKACGNGGGRLEEGKGEGGGA